MANIKKQRIKQVYTGYLNSIYDVEYYKRQHVDIARYSQHYEFVIALGGALSGGTGLGILASPWMAAPCGVITAASLIFTVAKQTYDWPGRMQFAVNMIDEYGRLSGKFRSLVEDIWTREDWTDEFEKTFIALREEATALPQDIYPQLKADVRNEIQSAIVARENPASWWKGPADA
jgi:hypothetical protein